MDNCRLSLVLLGLENIVKDTAIASHITDIIAKVEQFSGQLESKEVELGMLRMVLTTKQNNEHVTKLIARGEKIWDDAKVCLISFLNCVGSC